MRAGPAYFVRVGKAPVGTLYYKHLGCRTAAVTYPTRQLPRNINKAQAHRSFTNTTLKMSSATTVFDFKPLNSM